MHFSIEFQRNNPVWDVPTVFFLFFRSCCFRDRMEPKGINDRNINLKDRFFLLNSFWNSFLYFSNIFYLTNNNNLSKTDARENSSLLTLCSRSIQRPVQFFINHSKSSATSKEGTSFIKLETTFPKIRFRIPAFLAILIFLFDYSCQHMFPLYTLII